MGIDSLNERLGQWVDQQLQPLVVNLPGYLRDTKQLLSKLEGMEWKDEFRWVTCDILVCTPPFHTIWAFGL